MAKNTIPQVDAQGNLGEQLLDLLSRVCNKYAQTFSWYTSTKGRVWLTLKGRDPITYSTSVECAMDASVEETFNALSVLIAAHFGKVIQVEPPLVTWISRHETAKHLDRARIYVLDLYNGVLTATEAPVANEYWNPQGAIEGKDEGQE